MTKADYYRRQHLEMKNQKMDAISWPKTILESLGLMVAIAIILAVCILAVPEM